MNHKRPPSPTPPASVEPPYRLAPRRRDAHKGDYGRVLVVGGSRGMAGSIGLTASSALRSGAGLVTAAIPDRCLETVAMINPCVMTFPLADDARGHFSPTASDDIRQLPFTPDAIALGPGMGTDAGAHNLLNWFLAQECPRVLDADGLNTLASLEDWSRRTRGPLVLTPHPGEWSRLADTSPDDRSGQCQAAKQLAGESGSIVLLKGADTFITDGQREYVNATGNPGMATAGSGDCLTGIIATLLAQKLEPFTAACLAAWMHGRAGDQAAAQRGMAGVTALDLLDHLPSAIAEAEEP